MKLKNITELHTTDFSTIVLIFIFATDSAFGQTPKNEQESIFNKKYRNIQEFNCFSNYKEFCASMIDSCNDTEFAISHIFNKNKHIILFEIIFREDIVRYLILDTIQINNLKKNQYISFRTCRKDTIVDSEIIAIVILDESAEYSTEVVCAWRADRRTRKIIRISPIGIDCLNDGFDAD